MRRPLPLAALLALAAAAPLPAQDLGEPLADAELATITGKFILPGGGSLALSVTSDTMLNGALVLRTVLTVDQGSRVQVYGRSDGSASAPPTAAGAAPAAPVLTSGASVLFDRRSGAQIVPPTVSTIRVGGIGAAGAGAAEPGLTPIAVAAGGPAVRTPDGLVSVATLAGGTQVSLAGDQIGIAHLVGPTVATAILNAGNDRTIDTVTTIGIDLHDAAALAMGSAAMKVDALAADASRGMVR
ncbi:hypothetical protein [Sphingomonas abaci]|uniref:DUF5666 domain-containing protein n=1 Tax=Sphingomonas abaci TaxID=237611 RepID=A0A7W7AHV4_9SPHN|nr:hypothetical protein [Sphingomonas abaci]MBB4616560.1 hypothetical protein [Sphingomonas abaci]